MLDAIDDMRECKKYKTKQKKTNLSKRQNAEAMKA
jgi:hypothetical protein